MAECLADCGLPHDVWILCEERAPSTGLDASTYAALIRASVFAGDFPQSDRIWCEANVSGIAFTSHLYGAYLASLAQRGMTAEFDIVFRGLLDSGETPIPGHYAMRIGLCVTVSEALREVLPLMRANGAPLTSEIAKTLLVLARKSSDKEGAMEVMRLCSTSGVPLGEREYTELMCVMKDAKDLDGVREAYASLCAAPDVRIVSEFPYVVHLNAILNHAAVGDAALEAEAEALFEASQALKKVTYRPWSVLFNVYAALGLQDKAVALFHRLEAQPQTVKGHFSVHNALQRLGIGPPKGVVPRRGRLKEWHDFPLRSGSSYLGRTPAFTSH
eukprot:TRINITY_DN17986_c0_g3_i2.p1 TRINITY_DN17986_c0_g3~~TRINITY_DN17986_c0_g3_i2.p1  ORF type:complete len:338 (+),score=57.55 TRINITY_DN17986_c0_g3_i2:26-1015(+)